MFRPVIVAALLALTVLAPTSAVAQTPVTDEAAVRALVEAYSAARDKGDAAALTALFTADADQLVSSGEWRRGREAVVKGSLASSQQAQGKRTFTIDTVRMIAANVALADSRYEIAQTDGATRRMWASWLLVKDGGAWKIAAIRNMLPAAPAGAAATRADDVPTWARQPRSGSAATSRRACQIDSRTAATCASSENGLRMYDFSATIGSP